MVLNIHYGLFPPMDSDSDSDSKRYRYTVLCTTFSTGSDLDSDPWTDSFLNGYCIHFRDGSLSQGQISVPIPYIWIGGIRVRIQTSGKIPHSTGIQIRICLQQWKYAIILGLTTIFHYSRLDSMQAVLWTIQRFNGETSRNIPFKMWKWIYLSHANYFKRLLSLPESIHGQTDHKYALQLAHQAYNLSELN